MAPMIGSTTSELKMGNVMAGQLRLQATKIHMASSRLSCFRGQLSHRMIPAIQIYCQR